MPPQPTAANERLPRAPHRRLWGSALLLALLALIALEVFWRSLGYTPSITDNQALWAQQRQRVETANKDTLLLLGSSRILQAFNAQAFRETLPDQAYIQLAIGGLHPMATLQDIAENTSFNGTVLCSITAESLLPELHDQQQPWIDYYHNSFLPHRNAERHLHTALQSRLTLLLPDLLLQEALPKLLRGSPPLQYLVNAPDRTQIVDYNKVDLKEFTRIQLKKVGVNVSHYINLPDYHNFPRALDQIETAVLTIHQRGGHVVFLRMPTTGPYFEATDKYFPRTRFWDIFAAQTTATTIHFQDHPTLNQFTCAEGSHLYPQDTPAFTKALLQEINPTNHQSHQNSR